ncbi:STAS domain-containing protein [bacterium]|nr:STAS domain-containing protein [bacterium]
MDIELKYITPTSLYVKAFGRLDIDNAMPFGIKIKDEVEDNNVSSLTLDFAEVTFISSFGLKVILETYQVMQEPAVIKIINASDTVKHAFLLVGFDKFIDIK